MSILLVRHTAVALAWAGRCYGVSDMGLSRAGSVHARTLAQELAAKGPDCVIHSGLRRTRILAERIAAIAGVPAIAAPAWRERDFGTWEGRRWTAIHRETGDAMDGMIDAPDRFRPGGGETTTDLAVRARAALTTLPPGRVIVVTHGGPIAALRGLAADAAPRDWLALVPPTGGTVAIDRV